MKIKPILAMTALSTAMAVSGSVLAQNATDTNVTPAQKNQIEGVVHSYLVQNPEVVVESLQAYQQKQMQQVKKNMEKTQEVATKFAGDLFNNATDPTAGNPKGTVTVVEFFDYQCPHCVDMEPTISGVIKGNSNLRVVFKDFPIRGPLSEYAARASLAAQKQGKYFEMHSGIMQNAAHLTQDGIMDIAKNIGLDVDKLKADMQSKEVDDQLKANYKLAQSLGLMGTPAVFVAKSDIKNGAPSTAIGFVPGQIDQTQLQQLIDKAKS